MKTSTPVRHNSLVKTTTTGNHSSVAKRPSAVIVTKFTIV